VDDDRACTAIVINAAPQTIVVSEALPGSAPA
jgi:hypothetical protein